MEDVISKLKAKSIHLVITALLLASNGLFAQQPPTVL